MARILNLIFAVLVMIVVALLVNDRIAGSRLRAEHERLAVRFGELPVTDDSKFMITFIPDAAKRKFLWRVYTPELPNGLRRVTHRSGGWSSSNSNSQPASETRIFVNYRCKPGNPELFTDTGGGSSVSQFDRPVRKLIENHWDELDFRILANDKPVEVSTDEILRVFSISIPEKFWSELPDDLTEDQRVKYTTKPILEISIGESSVLKGP